MGIGSIGGNGVKSVQRGVTSITSGNNTTSYTISLPNAVNMRKSVVLISYQGIDDRGHIAPTAELVTPSTIKFTARFLTSSSATVTVSWQVIEYR